MQIVLDKKKSLFYFNKIIILGPNISNIKNNKFFSYLDYSTNKINSPKKFIDIIPRNEENFNYAIYKTMLEIFSENPSDNDKIYLPIINFYLEENPEISIIFPRMIYHTKYDKVTYYPNYEVGPVI